MKKIVLTMCLIILAAASLQAHDWETVHFAGTVTDDSGKPMNGATVLINQISNAQIGGFTNPAAQHEEFFRYLDSLKTLTGADGKYDLPLLLKAGDEKVRCELWFDKKQFVRVEKVVDFSPRDGIVETLDAKLQPGLIMSGKIYVPEIENKLTANHWIYVFEVTNKDFDDTFITEKAANGGAFAIYIPPGEYQIKVWDAPSQKFEAKAGTTNLLLEPPPFVWSTNSIGEAFDGFWQAMDRNYSYFFLKTNVDWKALKDEYRPRAIQATNSNELAKLLRQMLAPLQDLHIEILTPHDELPSYISHYTFNGNGKVILQELTETNRIDHFALVAKTKKDGFGYFVMLRQSNASEENVKQVVAAIQKLRAVPGFIVDLRVANGGSEPLAQEIASQFCAKDTVYAKSKYRHGLGHEDFTKEYERILKASPNPCTNPVVCIIGPGAVSSGEGFVQMMKCLPQVTTVGLPTRGASGNPQPYTQSGTGVTVIFSRWVDLMPDGQTFEGKGISPYVVVDEPPSAYEQQDPTLEKALEILRQKIAK